MKRTTTYANAPYGLCDVDFAKLHDEILSWDMRRDVRNTAASLAVHMLTRVWPASHFPKKTRDQWTHKATAAFQVAESELAELSGIGERKARTAINKMLEAGFVVELAPARPRGEGRGMAPRTLAFKCHVDTQSVSSERKEPDQSRPAQTTWRLGVRPDAADVPRAHGGART